MRVCSVSSGLTAHPPNVHDPHAAFDPRGHMCDEAVRRLAGKIHLSVQFPSSISANGEGLKRAQRDSREPSDISRHHRSGEHIALPT
jgi:hypothetical protein